MQATGDGGWDSDSDRRQFGPGRRALRLLSRSVSRSTKRPLLPGRSEQPPTDEAAPPGDGTGNNASAQGTGRAHDAGSGRPEHERQQQQRHGPPLPSGIHRRSVSFDNMPVLPDTLSRRSTQPSVGSPRSPGVATRRRWQAGLGLTSGSPQSPGSAGLTSASTWNSGAGADAGDSLQPVHPDAGKRQQWLAGLSHPLSTAVDGDAREAQVRSATTATAAGQRGMGGRARYHDRDSFSGPAQLDGSANLTDSQTTPLDASDPFQNRHARPHTSAELRRVARRPSPQQAGCGLAAEIVPSAPISTGVQLRRASGHGPERAGREPGQKLRGIARAIGNLSRRLTGKRSVRSSSQPATPNEVRESILGSARRNLVHAPNGAGSELYRFLVNPEDPVSDNDDPRSDSPVLYNLSSGRSRHRRSPTFPSPSFAHLRGVVGGGSSTGGSTSGVYSGEYATPQEQPSESTDDPRRFETASQGSPAGATDTPPAVAAATAATTALSPLQASGAPQHSRGGGGEGTSTVADPTGGLPRPRMTNQGHDGSLSAAVREKLASDFGSNVLVSTRLTRSADVQTMSSYGAFIRFHNSGELNGIYVSSAGPPVPGSRASRDGREEASTFSYAASSANAPMLAPMAHSRGQDYMPVPVARASTYGSGSVPRAEPEPHSRYMRNQDSIRRFVDEMRVTRNNSKQRQSEADEQRRVWNSAQAGLDAAVYIYERQRRGAEAAAQPELQQGRDIPTHSTASNDGLVHASTTVSTVMPAGSSSSSSSQPDHVSIEELTRMPPRSADSRRRETVFGMFDAERGPDTQPTPAPTDHPAHRRAPVLNKDLPPLPPRPMTAARPVKASGLMKRSQSLSRVSPPNLGGISTGAAPLPPPRARGGLLSGLLGRLTGGHDRRKSSGATPEPGGPSVVQRKLARRPPGRPGATGGATTAAAPAPPPAVAPLPLPLARVPAAPRASRALDSIDSDSTGFGSTDTVGLAEIVASGASRVVLGTDLADSSCSIGYEHQPRALAAGAPAQPAPTGLRHDAGPAAGIGRGRNFSVALDTITARGPALDPDRVERPATRRGDHVPRSMPQSRAAPGAASSDDSFAEMIASEDPDNVSQYRTWLPGLGTPAPRSPPTTAGGRSQRLEDAVLFGGLGLRPAVAALDTPADSPASDAETGRTQILGFATADVADDSSRPAVACVRPAARPEILDVRGIGWASPARTHADTTTTADDSTRESFDSSEDRAARALAALGGLNISRVPAEGEAGTDKATGADLDPRLLAVLVQQSPDPRSLIYGAGSQFGTMRPPKAPAQPSRPPMPPMPPRAVEADTSGNDDSPPAKPPRATMAAGPPPHLELLLPLVAATESEALARASIQATPSASPAVAPRALQGDSTPPTATSDAQPATQRNPARLSFQEYIEQQRVALRTPGSGQEQREFRVSLLERKPPTHGSRTRSWSLPAPRPALAAYAIDRRRLSMRAAQDPSPLVQALLLQQQPIRRPSASASGSEALEDAALFSTLLGDGAALTSPDVKVARRQSGALLAGPTPPPPLPLPFDPEVDTGDDGMPDSVLRAYMAGDVTAIERFFEHIMRLTAPSSVYDSELSEDGDWAFGIEGPPPEVLEQRAAAAAAAAAAPLRQNPDDASREMPGMVDVSADASWAVGLGPDSPRTLEPAAPATNGHRGPDPAAAAAEEVPAETPASSPGNEPSSAQEARKIAVPRSRLSQGGHQRRSSGVLMTPETPTTPETSTTPETCTTPSAGQLEVASGAVAPAVGGTACFSAGRGRSHNLPRQASDAGWRRPPLPVGRPPVPVGRTEPKGGEKRLLMARLRVLETIIQKTVIAASRVQPPPADPPSGDSGRGSSPGGLNYDGIRQELHAPPAPRPPPVREQPVRGTSANVLQRLRRGSHARAQVPFRAGMLARAAVSPAQSTSAATAAAAVPDQQWPSEAAEPSTSARDASAYYSDMSIHVDIVDDTSSMAESSAADIETLRQALRLAATDRFRRTTKLLAL